MVQQKRQHTIEAVVDCEYDRSAWCPKAKRLDCDIQPPQQQGPASPEALAFLDGLARISPPASLGNQGSGMYWLCVADLNLLMARWFVHLPSNAIRSYHSFTRTNKMQLWERVLASSGLAPLDEHTYSGMGGPVHLQLLNTVMMRVFAAYPEAAIIKYSFLTPDWMFGWSHKWGFSGKEICVLAVYAHTHNDMQDCNQPVRCIYIPVFA